MRIEGKGFPIQLFPPHFVIWNAWTRLFISAAVLLAARIVYFSLTLQKATRLCAVLRRNNRPVSDRYLRTERERNEN